MKNIVVSVLLAGATFLGFSQIALADDSKENRMHDWQLKRLMQPSQFQLAVEEKKQKVFIYTGLKDKEIEVALNTQFDRIENLMFTQIVKTDKAGKVMRDPATGVVITEEDGCE